MGPGFQGRNELIPCTCGFIWSSNVIPGLVYGLVVHKRRKLDFEKLELLQGKHLCHIQGLPDRVSNPLRKHACSNK